MIKFYLFKSWAFLILALSCSLASAQTRVTGSVTSGEDESALPGVSILEKGTTTVLLLVLMELIPSAQVKTRYSYFFCGFVTQEVSVGAQTSVNVTLASDVTALSEVVIIGSVNKRKRT